MSAPEAVTPPVPPAPVRKRLPDERQAITHKFSIAGHEGYLTVGLYEDGTPGEIFLNIAKEGTTISGLLDGFAISISMALQHGVPLAELVAKFKDVRYEPSGFTKNPAIPYAKSITDYVANWLALKFLSTEEQEAMQVRKPDIAPKPASVATDAPLCRNCRTIMKPQGFGRYYVCLKCGATTP